MGLGRGRTQQAKTEGEKIARRLEQRVSGRSRI